MNKENQQTRSRNDSLFRDFKFERSTVNEQERSVELSFSSETPVSRWFGNEILGHNAENIDMTRFTDGMGAVLFNHDPNQPIGTIESAWIDQEARKCKAKVRFDNDPDSDKIFQKVLSGSLKGVSVGYMVSRWEDIDEGEVSSDGRVQGPACVATRWQPYEVSITPIPADAAVGVGRAVETPAAETTEETDQSAAQEDNKRSEESVEEKTVVTPAVPEVNQEEVRAQATAAERQRTAEITAMCREFDKDPQPYIQKGDSVEQVRAAMLEVLKAERGAVSQTQVVADEADKFRAAAADAIALRAGLKVEKAAPGAMEMRGMKLMDLARECVERSTGKRAGYGDPMSLVRDAITGTSDFPTLLSNVANNSMAQAYLAAPATFESWTRRGSLSDFKTATRVRLSEAGELAALTELGEYQHDAITEAGETVKLKTYGKRFSISRQAIINDDLSALASMPQKYAQGARRMVNNMAYAILNVPPTLSDAKALFHADHKNLGTAGLISIAALGEAQGKMKRQTNIGGKEALNIQARYLIVPPEQFVLASQIVGSSVDGTKTNAIINPFFNGLTIISDAALTDTKAWFLAADPSQVDTVEINYLNGVETPMLESRIGFDVDGIEYKIRLDVGVSALEYRGLFKNAGA